MYLPKIAILTTYQFNIALNIKPIDEVVWHSGYDEHNLNIKYFIEFLKFPISTIGFNIDEIIKYLKVTFSDYNVNEDNIHLHIHNNNWNFYYPREFENIIIDKVDEKIVYSLDEYWIKEIIE